MDVKLGYKNMTKCFNMKKEWHHRAHLKYKNRELMVFILSLMLLQLINAMLPQLLSEDQKYGKTVGMTASFIAAVSAIWLGFQAKQRYGERSVGHKNAATFYQHLTHISMIGMQSADVRMDNDIESFLIFQEMVQNLEAGAIRCNTSLDYPFNQKKTPRNNNLSTS